MIPSNELTTIGFNRAGTKISDNNSSRTDLLTYQVSDATVTVTTLSFKRGKAWAPSVQTLRILVGKELIAGKNAPALTDVTALLTLIFGNTENQTEPADNEN